MIARALRCVALIGVVPSVLRAQPITVRASTQYAIISPVVVDTAQVSAAFRSGLMLDSLVRILAPAPDTGAIRPMTGRLERSTGSIVLECTVVGRRGKLRTRWIAIASGGRAVLDSAVAVPLDSLATVAGVLGRQAARHIHSPPAPPAPNERGGPPT